MKEAAEPKPGCGAGTQVSGRASRARAAGQVRGAGVVGVGVAGRGGLVSGRVGADAQCPGRRGKDGAQARARGRRAGDEASGWAGPGGRQAARAFVRVCKRVCVRYTHSPLFLGSLVQSRWNRLLR